MEIGNRLQIARKSLGCKLDEVAEQTGIGVSSLSEFENGKREPRFSQLSRLAEFYRRPVDFFLSDKPVAKNVLLWRNRPTSPEQESDAEARFRQLCEQYHRLEVLMGQRRTDPFPRIERTSGALGFTEANDLAEEFRRKHLLGDIPSTSLRQVLEERLYVKMFHLEFEGSAISTISEEFGPAILLNLRSKLRRRAYDLAHELFHLLTWNVFRDGSPEGQEPSDHEEKLANAFASRLLLPTDAVRSRIERMTGKDGLISLEDLDEIAREFGVSLDALLWRLVHLCRIPPEKIQEYVEQAQTVKALRPSRRSDEPDPLPERYCSLAIRALNEGKLSLIQFAKYMGLSYKQAQAYLAEESRPDETISIPVA